MYYIINPEQYKKDGRILNTSCNGTHADYTNGLTIEEYIEREGVSNYKVLTWEEFEPYLLKYKESICGPWEEISEERYNEMLNVLPPMKWGTIETGVSSFFISEGYTMDLHACFICDKNTGKHYEALRSIHLSPGEIYEDYKRVIKA